jgi:D-aminopeptidase
MVKGGLGSASLVLPDGSTVGALVAANPVGAVTTPGDEHFFAAPFEIGDEFGGQGVDPATGLGLQLDSRKMQAMSPRENTTIAIIATDAPLTKAQCQRVAVAAHDGIARATVPAHTPHDGDLVFALSTGTGASVPDTTLIGHAAAQCLARAIARAAFEATPAPRDLLPCWRTLNA